MGTEVTVNGGRGLPLVKRVERLLELIQPSLDPEDVELTPVLLELRQHLKSRRPARFDSGAWGWVPCPSFPGYGVSCWGCVKSLSTDRILHQKMRPSLYFQVGLIKDGVRFTPLVHRLVCEAFHGTPIWPRDQVNHINGERFDNRVENLEWVTARENVAHSWKLKRHRDKKLRKAA